MTNHKTTMNNTWKATIGKTQIHHVKIMPSIKNVWTSSKLYETNNKIIFKSYLNHVKLMLWSCLNVMLKSWLLWELLDLFVFRPLAGRGTLNTAPTLKWTTESQNAVNNECTVALTWWDATTSSSDAVRIRASASIDASWSWKFRRHTKG